MKKIIAFALSLVFLLVLTGCAKTSAGKFGDPYDSLKSADIEVSYENPEIKKDTNLGAEMPYIEYEIEHKIILSHSLGIFIYDLDASKMLRAIKLSDSKIHIGAQGDSAAVVQVDDKKQTITINEVGSKPLDYFYKYDINSDKLYKCPIGELDTKIKKPETTGQLKSKDWTAWNLLYTSNLTGKTYYPFREIIE